MTKYINADSLISDIKQMRNTPNGYSDTFDKSEIIGVIEEHPAADVRENEYSHKVWCPDGSKDLQCAECRAFVDLEDKYCHECGRVLLSEG